MKAGKESDNYWDRSLRRVNAIMEGFVRRMPVYRSVTSAFRGGAGEMVDWEKAREIALMVAQSEGSPPPVPEHARSELEAMMRRSEGLVREYSRLDPQEAVGPLLVFSRMDWIETNLASFRLVFEPLAESYGKSLRKLEERRKRPLRLGRGLTRGLITAQLGMVIGYLARGVLGQFDLGLPRPENGGKLYIVYPNLLKAEARMRLVPQDFRLWITLHEVTHAIEFAANPWIKRYLRELIEEYFRSISLRLEEMGMRLRPRELGDLRKLNEIIRQGGLMSVVHTPQQRELLSRIQAFMSLVEGYSNFIMDLVGEEIIPSFKEMSGAFRRRRESKSGAERFVERMLGFDLKLQQYKVGERFCKEVAERRGLDFLNLAWRSEEDLPHGEEIRNPSLWIDRMGSGARP